MWWIVLGLACRSVDWSECGPERSRSEAPFQIIGEYASDSLGQSLATGDIDGDGYEDILVGVPNFDTNESQINAGQVLLFLGTDLIGKSSLRSEDAFLSINGVQEAGGIGSSLGISDTDGDGLDDLWIGAHKSEDSHQDSGVVYWFSAASLPDRGATITVDDADIRWIGENSYDYAGFVMSTAGDVDGDEVSDWLIGAHQADASEEDVGKSYLILSSNFINRSGDISLSEADTIFEGETVNDFSGYSVSGGVDIDKDGLDDIVIGAGNHDGSGEDSGAGYVFLGASIKSGVMNLSQADIKLIGENEGDWAGKTVHMIPSMDKDGRGDIAISAIRNDAVGNNSGAVYLLRGSSLHTSIQNNTSEISLTNADLIIAGLEQESFFGQVLSYGDLDGDRFSDLLVGSPLHDYGSSADVGLVHLFFGKDIQEVWGQQITPEASTQNFVGDEGYDALGTSIQTGDLNKDRIDELILGIPYVDDVEMNAGGVSIFSGCES